MQLGPIRVVRRGSTAPSERAKPTWRSKRAAQAIARREVRAEQDRILRERGRELARVRRDLRTVAGWPEPRPDHGPLRPGLRLVAVEDRDAFLASIDDEVRHWQGYDDAQLAFYAEWFRDLARPRRSPRSQQGLAVTWDGDFAGTYSVTPSGADGADVELGWWLAPAYRGRGLGHTSLAAVLDHAHHGIGATVVRMGTSEENVRARRQIEATGAALVGEVDHTLPDGRVVAGCWYHHRAG